mmetsp:Transcript_27999/g.65420  ORF Transcript_27999/g.65420 Transcript_27999/m.65420 type:complete len:201 (-) Transcript_27999:313-915(-)
MRERAAPREPVLSVLAAPAAFDAAALLDHRLLLPRALGFHCQLDAIRSPTVQTVESGGRGASLPLRGGVRPRAECRALACAQGRVHRGGDCAAVLRVRSGGAASLRRGVGGVDALPRHVHPRICARRLRGGFVARVTSGAEQGGWRGTGALVVGQGGDRGLGASGHGPRTRFLRGHAVARCAVAVCWRFHGDQLAAQLLA